MKTSPLHLCAAGCGVLLCFTSLSLLAADATPKPSGPPKVRVIVKENNLATTAGGGPAASPAPAGAANRPQGAGKPGGAQVTAPNADDAEKYTHTTKKSLTIEVVNLTGASMEVNVKATLMAKDEAGKHEVLPEKTVENKLTLQPAKSGQFTTEEVSFSHTTAHRSAPPRGAGGGGAGKGGKSQPAPMIPASGHAYFGYKVEVFEGESLVGSTMSENH